MPPISFCAAKKFVRVKNLSYYRGDNKQGAEPDGIFLRAGTLLAGGISEFAAHMSEWRRMIRPDFAGAECAHCFMVSFPNNSVSKA